MSNKVSESDQVIDASFVHSDDSSVNKDENQESVWDRIREGISAVEPHTIGKEVNKDENQESVWDRIGEGIISAVEPHTIGKEVNKDENQESVWDRIRESINAVEPHTIGKKVNKDENQESVWDRIRESINAVEPHTIGKKGIQTHNVQKALTLDRLEQLHGSLKNCPDENTLADDPLNLKVELLPHQKYALSWLMWRESQKPSGGILADGMGLGKTLTMISLTIKSVQNENNTATLQNENGDSDDEVALIDKKSKYPGGTLVVSSASLIYQWESEVHKHVKKNQLSIYVYHGSNREYKAKRLSKYDMVITTYGLVSSDNKNLGPLFSVKWRRIIVDEAHQIRNYKTKTFKAVDNLSSNSRWALTGTPIHNKELDLYALLKFLRCSPFDDLEVWRKWISYKSAGAEDRLKVLVSTIILRRTISQLQEMNHLKSLPEKTRSLVTITLDKEETSVYQKVLIFSRTLFAQFLHQRALKNDEYLPSSTNNPNEEYFKMHRHLINTNRVKTIKQHEILVLLLRLRQICCHPSLITSMLNEEDGVEFSDNDSEDFNLLEQLNKLNLKDENIEINIANNLIEQSKVGLAEASKDLLKSTNPIFAKERKSSKIKEALKILKKVLTTDDKIIVVSQWTSLLEILALELDKKKVSYFQLNGKTRVSKRMKIVENFNNPNIPTKILLLSLCAGGVGLNLVGANHLILMDLHWNPQLEIQAQDRIYRVGQNKPVHMYKLITVDTIEERIKQLQEKKLQLAEVVLDGAKVQQSSLSLEDLKSLFNM